MRGEDIAIPVVFGILATATGYVTKVIAVNLRRVRTARARADMQNKIIDRFGSAPEFLAYLQSTAGVEFMGPAAAEEADPPAKPHWRILAAASVGIIASVFGGAMLVLRQFLDKEVFVVIGTLSLAAGIGFLASALVSYRLSKEWGLLNGHNGHNRQ
jgi:hypothetical protein